MVGLIQSIKLLLLDFFLAQMTEKSGEEVK